MKIAMFTNTYRPVVGGVTVSIERLSGALHHRGHEVTIFAPSCEEERAEPGVMRFGRPKPLRENGMLVPDLFDEELFRHFERTEYDIIHLHHPMMVGYTGMMLAKMYDIPAAITYHTRYEYYMHHLKPYATLQKWGAADIAVAQQLVAGNNRFVGNLCDLIFAPTPFIEDYLKNQGIHTPIQVLPTGLSKEDFAYQQKTALQLRRQYLKEGQQYLFCCVARLEAEKNLSFLLKSLSIYKQKFGDTFQMLFIGDGSCKQSLAEEAAHLGLQNNVTFTGNILHEQLANYYRACDLFLFASQSETQGIVLLEAMAVGLPVVAVCASGVCDCVVNGHNGWMTEPDCQQFANTIFATLSDEALYAHLRQGANDTAQACTAAQMAQKAEEGYEWMLSTAWASGKGRKAVRTA